MNDIRTESGSTIITISADRAWNRKTRQMIVTMIACWISVFFKRVDRAEDQLRSVVGRDEADAVRQAQRGDLGLERLDHLERIRADAHHDDAADGLAGAVPVGGAASDLRPEADARDVAEPDGRAARHRPSRRSARDRPASLT